MNVIPIGVLCAARAGSGFLNVTIFIFIWQFLNVAILS